MNHYIPGKCPSCNGEIAHGHILCKKCGEKLV